MSTTQVIDPKQKRTVVLLLEGHGEYDAYTEQVIKAYVINKKNFNFHNEYTRYYYKEAMKIEGLEAELWSHDGVYQIRYTKVPKQKVMMDLYKRCTPIHYAEEVLKLKPINFTEYLTR